MQAADREPPYEFDTYIRRHSAKDGALLIIRRAAVELAEEVMPGAHEHAVEARTRLMLACGRVVTVDGNAGEYLDVLQGS